MLLGWYETLDTCSPSKKFATIKSNPPNVQAFKDTFLFCLKIIFKQKIIAKIKINNNTFDIIKSIDYKMTNKIQRTHNFYKVKCYP